MNIRKLIATATVALLAGGGLALASTTAASAHTPEITDTCTSIDAVLTNYEYVPGSPAEFETKVITPAVPAVPEVLEVLGDPPLISAAVPAVTTVENEYTKETGVYGESMTKWFPENANPQGWVATGNFRIVEITPAQPAVYGPQPVLVAYQPAIPAQAEVTAQVETKAAVPAQDNTITLILDGVTVAGPIHFGTSYTGSYPLTGTQAHSYKVVIDAIGTKYDKTITGKTTVCPPVNVEVPTLTVTPPTCDTDGTLPFLGNPAAQNPNGYEFPGEGFRVYISPAFSGPGTYTATIQKIGAGFDPAFPYGTKVTGETSQTLVVAPAIGFHDNADGQRNCYVAPPVVTPTTEVVETVDCETSTVLITTTTTTPTFTFDSKTGVHTEGDPIVEVTTDTREATAEECPVVVPPTEEPPVVEPPVVTPPVVDVPVVDEPLGQGGDEGLNETLAQTGSTLPIAAGVLAILAIAAGTGALVLRRRQHAAE